MTKPTVRDFDQNERNVFQDDSTGCVAKNVVAEVRTPTGEPIEVTAQTIATPKIYNVTSPGTANTEFSQALTANVKKFLVRARNMVELKLAFASGDSGTTYVTIPRGATFVENGINSSSLTLYMQCTKTSEVVEILEWT